MMDDVVDAMPLVVDDFVAEDALLNLSALLQERGWVYGWRSSKGHHYGLWHRHIAGGDKNSRVACDDELRNEEANALIQKIWDRIKEEYLSGYSLLRVYANGQTYGLDGGIHVDHIDEGECCTAIVYAHENWSIPWGGEIVFYDHEGELLRAIHPSSGRLIVFDSALPHVARAPSRECPVLRVSLVFKAIKDEI